jgi:hypothetical protein
MFSRAKARYLATAVAAVAIAMLVVSPAIGGPSLKSLVKKEVAKQLRGKSGPQGPPGAPGTPGTPGAPGADANPRAFASISYAGNADNVVKEAGSSVITDANVHRQGAGLYCIYGLPFTPRNAQATLNLVGSGAADEVYVYVVAAEGVDSADCPNDTGKGTEQVEVFVDDNGDPLGSFAGTDAPFYLTID